ncbi:MAG: hypothetical protein HQL53_04850, partial [Magnetococcales bacterium]|nr:hypothetical protein [Magnetococcales bacterium]
MKRIGIAVSIVLGLLVTLPASADRAAFEAWQKLHAETDDRTIKDLAIAGDIMAMTDRGFCALSDHKHPLNPLVSRNKAECGETKYRAALYWRQAIVTGGQYWLLNPLIDFYMRGPKIDQIKAPFRHYRTGYGHFRKLGHET